MRVWAWHRVVVGGLIQLFYCRNRTSVELIVDCAFEYSARPQGATCQGKAALELTEHTTPLYYTHDTRLGVTKPDAFYCSCNLLSLQCE